MKFRFIMCMTMSTVLIPLFLAHSQQTQKDEIVVIGSASVDVPADMVVVKISLSYSDSTDGRMAYGRHKEAENNPMSLLHNIGVRDSSITYSLLNIRSYTPQFCKFKVYTTSQTVSVTIDTLSKYLPFQFALMSSGFSEFNENFESSKAQEGMRDAIQKAVMAAKSKAELIAETVGRKIKGVLKVMDTEESEPIVSSFSYYPISMNQTIAANLENIPQTISVRKQVKAIFELEDISPASPPTDNRGKLKK